MNKRRVATVLVIALGPVAAVVALAQDFDLSWHTIDGGGETFSAGGDFRLSGTIGQPDSGMLTGAAFELSGGFWFPVPPDDCNSDGGVNLIDYGDFDGCLSGPDGGLPAPGCSCFDLDGDSDIDLSDVAEFQAAFTGG